MNQTSKGYLNCIKDFLGCFNFNHHSIFVYDAHMSCLCQNLIQYGLLWWEVASSDVGRWFVFKVKNEGIDVALKYCHVIEGSV